MKIKRLYKISIVLFIIFMTVFFSQERDVRPAFSQYLPQATSSIIDEDSLENIKSAWEKTYRLAFIKKAVAEKLNHDNYVNISDIAPDLRNAIVAIEDNRFFKHNGFDIEGIIRAALVNLQSGALVEGGSTITQQLVKNLFLSPEKNWLRKAEEIILAINLELNYSKEEILEMYLNTIYFGSGAYGAKEASAVYFGKSTDSLSLAQCSLLAGIPNAPSLNSPYVDFKAAKQRQQLVLNAMVKYGYIERAEAQQAMDTPLKLVY